MTLSTVSDWLAWIETLHPTEIELGLDRVKEVAKRLDLLNPACTVITVGGTNGKGSTVAGLEAIYLAAGFKVGAFTSPILFKHNEQVRINQGLASDEAFCNAFAEINNVRGDISLTAFEFCTLAALCIFKKHPLDVLILEVGLGGRLDAVNIIDADVAVVTSISIDHSNWLGDTRQQIAREKAGIFRESRPAVCGDLNPPPSLRECADRTGAVWYGQQEDFRYEITVTDWAFTYANYHYSHLPLNHLAIQNMSTVLMVITLLQSRLPVIELAIHQGLRKAHLQGRVQVKEGPITEIYDVSHNPASCAYLAERLSALNSSGKTFAVFSMLADKDIVSSIQSIRDNIDVWYVAPLPVKRAASQEMLAKAFKEAGINAMIFFPSIQKAYAAAKQNAQKGDRLVMFGSFHTVALSLSLHRSAYF
jgi:dihydrofolate synthase/folylpolyglutamate synthase